jgi:glycerophosphoryl diester phosphodiesterase
MKLDFRGLFKEKGKIVVTAHRGFSGEFPENTLLAFNEAVKIGVDCLEFDLRSTSDLTPIVLHDPTLDRTTDGSGSPNDYSLSELKKLNASFFSGAPSDGTGRRLENPAYPEMEIPTFREVLESVPESVGLNIQAYQTEPREFLETICALYDEFDVYGIGYLTMSTFKEAEVVRDINPRIDLCVLERQWDLDESVLRELRDFGCDIIQPGREAATREMCALFDEMGFHANMFYSNTVEDNEMFISRGIRGILTDNPDVLLKQLGR